MEQLFTGLINPILEAVVLVLVPMLVAKAVSMVSGYLKVQVNTNTLDMLNKIAVSAVSAVEETAATAFKNGAVKWTSSMKQGAAIDKILAAAPSLTTEQAQGLVHSAVGMVSSLGASAVVPSVATIPPAPVAPGN